MDASSSGATATAALDATALAFPLDLTPPSREEIRPLGALLDEGSTPSLSSSIVHVVVVVAAATTTAATAAAMDNIYVLVGLAFTLDGSTATRAWATDSLLFICQRKERGDKEEK